MVGEVIVTVLTCTARSDPRWAFMADSIALQPENLLAESEWVIVDAKLWTEPEKRKAEVHDATRALRDIGMQIVHIPPKPCRWQGPARLTKSDYFALSNARNTGLVVARGQRIIAVDDCSVVADNWMQGHLRFGLEAIVCAAFYTYRSATVVDGKIVKGDPGVYGLDARVKVKPEVGRTNAGWAYGLSCSYPLEAAIAANGGDESYDGQGGSEDSDFGIRMERCGYPAWWNPEPLVYQILESHEPVFEHVGWDLPQKPKRVPKELRVRRDEKCHFGNEVLAERLVLDDIGRTQPANSIILTEWQGHPHPGVEYRIGHPFSLREMREEYKATGKIPKHPFVSDVDWRDGKPLSEMG